MSTSVIVAEGRKAIMQAQSLSLAVALTTALASIGNASAETYPSRPVRIIVGLAAGGGVDILARLTGQWLSERLGQPFVTENRPGAGGNIGTETVAKAPADGHTLLLVNAANAINASLYEKLNFDFNRDIVPIASIMRQPQAMLVNPSFPARSVPEFIAYARANPGKVNMGSAGNGTPSHLAGELFKMMAGVDLVHVPYRGVAPAMTDLLGGQVQVIFTSTASSIEYIKSGKLRPLAVTPDMRLDALPDIPTMSEFVPGYEATQWYGVGAPRNTSTEIVDRLNAEINVALADPKMKARLVELGGTVLAGRPADFGRLIAEETEKWGKVIRAARITAN
jgi:tripartite-type tricarboxylate transporter receptor subunit TctC